MAFTTAQLYRVASFGGNALYVYIDKDNDGAATIDTSGHMNNAADQLKVGDLVIRISASTFNATLGKITAVGSWGIHIVLSNAAGVVNLSDALAGVVTNTD